METKKSFILHIDSLGILHELSDEQAGQLFKLIHNYHNPEKPTQTQITQLVSLAFFPFKSQFERDFLGYQRVVERNRNNGKLGGRPKNKNPKKPKKPDNDNDNDNDSDKENTNTVILEYHKNPEKKETFVWQWLDYCLKLGYTPAKDETIEGISDFLTKTFLDNGINIDQTTGHDLGKSAMYRWFTYWQTGKKIKNFKNTFSNTIQYSIKK